MFAILHLQFVNIWNRDLCQLGSVAVGTNEFLVEPNFEPGALGNSFLLVYTQSSLVEQTGNAAIGIFDIEARVDSVSFTDLDLDPLEIGGIVTWNEPFDTSQVAFYDVYLGLSDAGENRSQVESPVAVLNTQLVLSADTAQGFSNYLLVYSRSTLVEQTTPAFQVIVDQSASVSAVAFTDFDVDMVTLVTHYAAYLADEYTGNRSQVSQDVAVGGVTQLSVATDTPKGSYTQIRVYVKSSFVEQSTAQQITISDTATLFDYLNFTDEDLDPEHFGGVLEWPDPQDVSFVEHYVVYVGESWNGTGRVDVSGELPAENRTFLVPQDQTLPYLLLYTKSAAGEQSTPEAIQMSDGVVSMSVSFTDQDFDADELGGTVYFSSSGDVNLVDVYRVYLSVDQLGTGRSQIAGDIPQNSSEVDLPSDTALNGFQYVLASAKSLFEQSTPSSIGISDISLGVTDLNFQDEDLDQQELGGLFSWVGSNSSLVTDYVVYLATNTSNGFGSSQYVGTAPVGTNQLLVPDSTAAGAFTHLLVYVRSSFAEQTTPSSLEFYDASATVGSVAFTDLDLDAGELGGNITWQEQGDVAIVSQYVLYMANASTPIDSVSVGFAEAVVPPDTATNEATELQIFTRH
ncbi:unnamed protein product [Durusdinium trenchii]|uniref:Uncharacterized protein n=1 Tax=Durusdinium trenchii TaxID=1381693 RepID=A0ABP0IV01_9DINO